MGRPLGSKNKPKVIVPIDAVAIPDKQKTVIQVPSVPAKGAAILGEPKPKPQEHVMLLFAAYVKDRMSGMNHSWYKKFSAKNHRTIEWGIIKSVMDLFNIQDGQLDLSKFKIETHKS